MSTAMTAAQWEAQLKKWKVDVTYLDGWKTRGRPDSTAGGKLAPNGIMIHHTGSDVQTNEYINWLFKQGRPGEGIPAPLANVMTMMNGKLVMGAIGKANHAGPGVNAILTKVINETVSLTKEEVPGATGTTNGNPRFYGNEVAFDGGQPMTPAQYNTVVRWCAAICDFHKWTGASIIGHGEWTKAKWDPGLTDMAKLRRDVNALLKAGPGTPAIPETPIPVPPKPVTISGVHWNIAGSDTVNGYQAENATRGDDVARHVQDIGYESFLACEAGQKSLLKGVNSVLGVGYSAHAKGLWEGHSVKVLFHKSYSDGLFAYLKTTKWGAAVFLAKGGKRSAFLEIHTDYRKPAKQAGQVQSIFKKFLVDVDALGIPRQNVVVVGDFNWDGSSGDNPFKALAAWGFEEKGSRTDETFLDGRHLDGVLAHKDAVITVTRPNRWNKVKKKLSDHFPKKFIITLR